MPNLTILDSRKITLDSAKPLPVRLKLMDWGKNRSAKGTFTLGPATIAQFAANQAATNFDRVALDFEHNTVPSSDTYKGEPAVVAGHGTPELVEGDGLYLSAIEWTPDGQKFVGGRHYTDLSPTILTNESGEVVFLHSAAVCRQGALVGRTIPLSASDLPALEKLTNIDDPKMKEILLQLLGLKADASEADIKAAALAYAKRMETLSASGSQAAKDDLAKLTADPALTAIFKGLSTSIDNLVATVKTQGDTLTALQAHGAKSELQIILASAAQQGKVIPREFTEGATAMSPAQLSLLVTTLPVTVPLDRRTAANVHGVVSQASLETLSAEETVRKQLGMSKKQWDETKAD